MDKMLFLFTTHLANQATEAVKAGRFQTMIAYHKSLEETKLCLSKVVSGKNSAKMHMTSNSYPMPEMLNHKSGECPSESLRVTQQEGPSGVSTPSRGSKLPPPNIKLEIPVNGGCCPASSGSSFKRDYSHNMIMNNDGGMLNSMPTILPYGLDASNMPIVDTHYGNFTSNGDPLEKMARLTQEALPFEPPLKQPKIEPSISEGDKPAGAHKSLDNVTNMCGSDNVARTGGSLTNSNVSKANKTLTDDDQLTPSQRQHRQEGLQTLEGLRNSVGMFANKLQMQQMAAQQLPLSFMPGMQCPPNMTTDMMLSMNVNMNTNMPSSHLGAPGALMHPNGVMLANNAYGLPGEQQKVDQSDMCVVPPVNEKIPKSSAARAATPKNSATGKSANPRTAQQPTMMVQGKPAVMVHPNMNAKPSRNSASRSASSTTASTEKFYPTTGPPNVTFMDASYGSGAPVMGNGPPFCTDPYPATGGPAGQQFNGLGGQFVPRAYSGLRFADPNPRFVDTHQRFTDPSARFINSQQHPAATAVVFNNGPRGPQQRAHGPNVNVNMNIQINAPVPPSNQQQQPQQQVPGTTDGITGSQGCYQQQTDFGMGPPNIEEEEVFYDQMYGPWQGPGSAMPSNVNIAVTGMYPPQSAASSYGTPSYYPPQPTTGGPGNADDPFASAQQGPNTGPLGPSSNLIGATMVQPPPFGSLHSHRGFGGPQHYQQGPLSDPTSGLRNHLAGPTVPSEMDGVSGSYRPAVANQMQNPQQMNSGRGTFVNTTMSIQHNVSMAGGTPYVQSCPQPNQPVGSGYVVTRPIGGAYTSQQRPSGYRGQPGGPVRPTSAQYQSFFGQFPDSTDSVPKMSQQPIRNQPNFARAKDQQPDQHQMPQTGSYDTQRYKHFQQQLYSINGSGRRGSESDFMGPPT